LETSVHLDLVRRLEQFRQYLPAGIAVYLVGGAVRNALLGLAVHDLDFVVEQDALLVARRLADALQGAYYTLDLERDTGRVILSDSHGRRLALDFAGMRGPDLESDLRARDFTINAIAINPHQPERMIDPLGGAADLHARVLRACSPQAFESDPVRILRAVRFASTYELKILPDTLRWLRAAIPRLGRVSAERLRDELFRMLESRHPAACLRVLHRLGVLQQFLPELSRLSGVRQPLPHVYDVWEHTLAVVQQLQVLFSVLDVRYQPDVSANLMTGLLALRLGRYRQQLDEHLRAALNRDRSMKALISLAALYHDAGKPDAQRVDPSGEIHFFHHEQVSAELVRWRAAELRLSNDEIERVATIVRHHMRPLWLADGDELPSRRAIYRFFRQTGAAGVDICLLSLADVLATHGATLTQERWQRHLDVARLLLEAWWEHPTETVSPPPLLSGRELMAHFDLQPGPQIGSILEAVREAQAAGQVNTLEQALELARSLLKQDK